MNDINANVKDGAGGTVNFNVRLFRKAAKFSAT